MELLIGIAIGFSFGLLGLLAVWFVFGPQAIWVRAGLVVLATIAVVEFFAVLDGLTRREATHVMLLTPAYILVATSLLWFWRFVSGWGLVVKPAENELQSIRPHQFRIRDLFVATGVVAIAAAMARMAIMRRPGFQLQFDGELIAPPFIVAASVLPCMWFVFRARISPFVLAYLYAIGLVVVEIASFAYFSRHGFVAGRAVVICVFQFLAIFVISAGLVFVRSRGVVLASRYDEASQPPLAPNGDFGHNLPQDRTTSPTGGDHDGGF